MSDEQQALGSGNTQLLLPIQHAEKQQQSPHLSGDVQSIAKTAVQSIAQERATIDGSVRQYLNAAIAKNTRRAYQQDLRDFIAWGGTVPSSPESLAAYIAARAETLSVHTITRRVVGISRAHLSQGHADPAKTDLVRTILRGVRRTKGSAQRQAKPLLKADVLAMSEKMSGVRGVRDRALVLLGFAAALRRSELAALQFDDIEFVREGLVVHLRRSKTDQIAEGRKIGVPWGRSKACAVKAVEEWIKLARIETGPLFRPVSRAGVVACNQLHAQSVALIVKAYAQDVGISPELISGHSLRSGLVTSAIQAGVPVHKIQQQTGHRSVEMLARYIRDAELFDCNASGAVL